MAFRFVIILIPVTILTTYFLNYYLIPEFLMKKRYFRFGLFFLYALIISITLELNVVMFTLISVADFQMDRMVTASFNVFYLIAGNYLVVFLAVAIKLLNQWYKMENRNLLLEKESMEIDLKLREAELKLLKAQVHPHFLFNTLNNLYGLALSGSKKTPEIVLKISSMLDFILYRSSNSYINLEEELQYIEDYIDLEKLRYTDLNIQVEKKGIVNNTKIAPMLLQPFIENAFKHGASGGVGPKWIRIKLENNNNGIEFEVENTKNVIKQDDKTGYSEGIGLKNIKKRLNILYPGKHKLDLYESEKTFKIKLNLNITSETDENAMPSRR